jgi:hypothetical protein
MGVCAGIALIGSMGVVAATAEPPAPTPRVEQVPFDMDSSNQAGWWRPHAEFRHQTYVAFNAPSEESENWHEVHIAVRSSRGDWSSECLTNSSGECVDYLDDIGHNQPSIAIDGDGYLHALVSMHNSAWRYYRSVEPESITMVDVSHELPDQGTAVTYPTMTTAPNGDVYFIARVNPGDWYSGRLYRWSNADRDWARVAVFARDRGFTPYPDDIQVDSDGNVHISWEWARGGPSASRYLGSYLIYQPDDDRFITVGGDETSVPVTTNHGGIVYEPGDGVVQSARFALVNTVNPELAGVAYRYRPVGGEQFEVRWAAWDGDQWKRETVTDSSFASPAAIAATHHGGKARIYYIATPKCDQLDLVENGGVFVAEKGVPGRPGRAWKSTWIGGAGGVERLAAETRSNGSDVLYLAAPRDGNPVADPALHFATLDRRGSLSPSPTQSGDTSSERKNLAYGADVSVSSVLNDGAIGECAVDGNFWAAGSRWISAADDPEPSITLDFEEPVEVGEVHVHSGHQGGTTALVDGYVVEADVDGEWVEIGSVTDNVVNPSISIVPSKPRADRLRLTFPGGVNRIYEVEVFSAIESSPVGLALAADPPSLAFPGASTELGATLINRTPGTVSGVAEVDVPDGWTAEPVEFAYDLGAHGQVGTTFHVTSPEDAPSLGSFELRVRTSPDDPGETVEVSIREGVVYSGDGAPFYTETGPWAASSLLGHDDTPTRYSGGESGATATWTPDLRDAGTYRLFAWYPTNPTTTTEAHFTVTHAGGTEELVVNQRDTADQWHQLGTWTFEAGMDGSVTLQALAEGYHRANAVRFERVIE